MDLSMALRNAMKSLIQLVKRTVPIWESVVLEVANYSQMPSAVHSITIAATTNVKRCLPSRCAAVPICSIALKNLIVMAPISPVPSHTRCLTVLTASMAELVKLATVIPLVLQTLWTAQIATTPVAFAAKKWL